MGERDLNLFDGYLDALIERDGAAASLTFLPEDKKAVCLARIAELDQILDRTEAAYGDDDLETFAKAVKARRHRVEDLIAHLERMDPISPRSRNMGVLLSKLQAAENAKGDEH